MGALVSAGLRADLLVRRSESFTLDLDLDIPPGRTVALLGPNGAGKSTAVAALAGLLPMGSGRIELAGRVLEDPSEGIFAPAEVRRIGVVFQDALLFPHLSVLENVAFGPRSRGVSREESTRRASHWLDRVGLAGFGPRRPAELSGGQAQRVALVRALATDPDLLLLDEPLSALDVSGRAELRRVLAEHLGEFPGPRLLITHDPAEAFQLADEIHVIEAGRVTQSGNVEAIRMRPRTPYVADLAGSNLLVGEAEGGTVLVGDLELHVAAPELSGPVRLSIRPSAVSVHRDAPGGSPRNRWPTVIERLEDHHGSRIRLLTGPPAPLMVEITPEACRELDLAPGVDVWLSVKATDIGVEPDGA